jgi:dCTP diphosphatase
MLSDETTTVRQLKDLVLAFTEERDWQQFHTPKDLGVALVCEVGELFEHFRYQTDSQIQARLDDPSKKREIADEVADCLWLILRIADVTGIDLASALAVKVKEAGEKYPVERSYGRPDKYTAYREDAVPDAERAAPEVEGDD